MTATVVVVVLLVVAATVLAGITFGMAAASTWTSVSDGPLLREVAGFAVRGFVAGAVLVWPVLVWCFWTDKDPSEGPWNRYLNKMVWGRNIDGMPVHRSSLRPDIDDYGPPRVR